MHTLALDTPIDPELIAVGAAAGVVFLIARAVWRAYRKSHAKIRSDRSDADDAGDQGIDRDR